MTWFFKKRMNFAVELRLQTPGDGILAPMKVKEADYAVRRRRALKRVDKELSKSDFKRAFSLVKQLQGKPFGLRGFGAAKQVPRNRLVLNQLEFNGIDLSPLGPLVDSVMDSIDKSLHFPLPDGERRGSSSEEDHFLCLQHEAGHFLVGYLLGALPKRYTVPSVEELRDGNFEGGKVEFLGFEFLREVGAAQMLRKNIINEESSCSGNRGKISSKTLNNFSCIILGGLVVEHLVFGDSEGHYSDVDKEQLDKALKWLGFSNGEANFQVRWAALNTVFVLCRHHKARLKLVEAMAQRQSVGFCIDAIENAIDGRQI
ncbi:uncharacterized protein LOC110635526 isoform X1 [Hevea brasiliensis]|uniref:uncharacterized protein LOC110635526 isoform X1 n=1 Tax=Hevea brasiliensis TaxID=3981 RepID=UPI0025F2A31C|nr:uncharacterized protein LOC110635526 isoform X1 [Hevea brasiliensis]XP_057998729.1 uncharacterized protein LOC110635526 isoform X1 [Hevea brasiliensis]